MAFPTEEGLLHKSFEIKYFLCQNSIMGKEIRNMNQVVLLVLTVASLVTTSAFAGDGGDGNSNSEPPRKDARSAETVKTVKEPKVGGADGS